MLLKLYFSLNFLSILWFLFKRKVKYSEIIGKYFQAVLLTVLHEVNFGLQKLATFSQSEQCYAVLKQLFSPIVIYK